MPEYTLVNPIIQGTMKTQFSGKNSLEAANKAYAKLSENFNNNIPKFYFTLQEMKTEKSVLGGGKASDYTHFMVSESKKANQVNFRITEHKVKDNEKQFKKFKESVKKISKQNQEGGKKSKKDKEKYDDFDDDDDDDYEFPKYKSSYSYSYPISSWWYDPYVYRLKSSYYYLPTYVAPLSPYVSVPLYDYSYII
tara:strand:+ start:614 stop:1195 length:582 start_codon:yes stop_codon:yes gene_type:complete